MDGVVRSFGEHLDVFLLVVHPGVDSGATDPGGVSRVRMSFLGDVQNGLSAWSEASGGRRRVRRGPREGGAHGRAARTSSIL